MLSLSARASRDWCVFGSNGRDYCRLRVCFHRQRLEGPTEHFLDRHSLPFDFYKLSVRPSRLCL